MKNSFTRLPALLFLLPLSLVAQNLTISIQSSPTTCNGTCTGKVDLSVTGGVPLYTYDWSQIPGVNNPQDLTGLCAGTFTVTVTDASGTTQTATAVITQLSSMVISETHVNAFCANASNGSIDLTVTGSIAPYTYLWSNGTTTQDQSNLVAGTYTVTVTDENNCSSTKSITITSPPPLALSVCITNANCIGTNGAIDLSATGGIGLYTYSWGNGQTTQDLNGVGAGTYTVTATDANGCTRSASATVTQPPQSMITTIVVTGSNIDLTVSGGSPSYTYSWSNGSNSQDQYGFGPGTYCVTITDATGCTTTTCATIQGNGNPGPLNIQGYATNTSCGSQCSGGVSLSVNGPAGSLTYLWTGPNGFSSTTQNISNICMPGTYCVTVSSADGTAATACFNILQGSSTLLPIHSSNAAFCNYDPTGSSNAICEKVCPHTPVSYFVEPPLNCGVPTNVQSGVWTVSGAESYSVSPDKTEVSVVWGASGAGLIKFEGDNTSLCFSSSKCITIVEEPIAQFISDPPAPLNAPLQLCKGQTVAFQNQSLHADVIEWQFSDNLSVLNEPAPLHTFLTPGTFTVTLIARSNCLCADTTVLTVEVLDTQPPTLDCVGSVCPGEEVTYTTSSNCSSYSWVVSPNGTVQSGGGGSDNSITILWNSGSTGSIALSATGCGGATCPQASVFYVPIISDDAEIRGPQVVCSSNEEDYEIEPFDGVEFTWTLPTGGSIIRGQGTNKVTVAWNAPASANTAHLLAVDYYNCYLGCGGSDTIPVHILSPFVIDGPVEMCENSTQNFTNKFTAYAGNLLCNWTIFAPNGALAWTSPTALVSISFTPANGAGRYRIFAVPANPNLTCSASAEWMINVAARPPKPAGIDGETLICPGTAYTYAVAGNPPFEFEWKIKNGAGAVQTQLGTPLNVTWGNTAPRWLSVAQVSTDGLNCKSDTALMTVQPLPGIEMIGTPAICVGMVGFYTTGLFPLIDYQWEIIPANAGTIKSGQNTNTLEIFWQLPGNHSVRLTRCGQNFSMPVTVHDNPEPMPGHPAALCPGATASAIAGGAYASYAWKTENGSTFSIAPTATVGVGTFGLQVTDAFGCKGAASFTIDELAEPNVSLSTTDPTGFCNNSSYVLMTALVPNDGIFTYQWLHDGNPVGGSNATYVTNQYGSFTVVVTNQYGCTGIAPPIQLVNYCGGGGGGNCPNPGHGNAYCPPGTVQAVADLTVRCDSFGMVLNDYSGQYVAGSAMWWTGISGTSGWEFATGDSVHFVYPNAGKYIISVRVQLSDGSVCEALDSLDVEARAQFSLAQACPGDSTLFRDQSTHLPEAAITAWAWDFGVAGNTDASNEASPGYAYASAGNYTATLTVTATSGCTSTASALVFVPDLPAPAFSPPAANCVNAAAAFSPVLPNDFTGLEWNFGDPASANLNTSEATLAYHRYSPDGTYTVTLTAENVYGCTAAVALPVTITPNPFNGNIFPPGPSTICEGKTISLSAPLAAGANYEWSTGAVSPTILVGIEGVYDVTLTNANGCSYSPPAENVEVNPAPVGVIKALEINEFGQVDGVSFPTLEVCAGDDVNLQIFDNGNFNYSWGGGNGSDDILIFSEDRDNLLTVGTYTYAVTITNSSTGCTAITTPFEVTVNALPTGFSLVADNVCAGLPSTLSYLGLQPPEWQILWNTGETGAAPLVVEEAGLYFVRVVNEHGCAAQSNTVVIFPGPNISALPSGCHERCNPDTLCIPALPDIVSWQWFFEGVAIPGATSSQLVATQSGTYWADLVDVNGCAAQSAELSLSLYQGVGNILGQVWADVNGNGVIDGADTLVSGIPVLLLENNGQIAASQSGANGDFDFLSVPSSSYTVQIDSLQLSPLWEIVIGSDPVALIGCDGKVFADLLLQPYQCPLLATSVQLSACSGSSASYFGTPIAAGQSQAFIFPGYLGCDSVVTVTVSVLQNAISALSTKVCPGATFQYEGVDLSIGQVQNFTFQNWQGCDSVVTVSVLALPVSASALAVSTCPGATYQYEGVDLSIGQTQDFTFQNWLGCDSVVTVTVAALPVSALALAVGTCPGTTFQYEGVDLSIGQTQDFSFQNWQGCDSVVTVTVSALPVSVGSLSVGVCPNETYPYQGATLTAGMVQDFILKNSAGCDSVVTVTVFAKKTSTELREVQVCPGEQFEFDGVFIAPGQTRAFDLSNSEGCDSIITIAVTAWPGLDFEAQSTTSCPNLPTGSLAVSLLPGGSLPVEYSLNQVDFQQNPAFDLVGAGAHILTLRDARGCIFEKTIVVPSALSLEVSLPEALVIPCAHNEIVIDPLIAGDTTGLQLRWWNGAQTTSVTVSEAGPIWLEVANHCESLRSEGEVVWADSEGEPISVYVPNIFLPEANLAENTLFRPFFGNNLRLLDYRLEVYDRWGNLVYETKTLEEGWSGWFDKKQVGTDVFVWQMWARVAFCGREIGLYKKGDVTVLR